MCADIRKYPESEHQGCASVRPTRRDSLPWCGTVRHGLAWRGLTWLIEVRDLANKREGLANRSEGLGAELAWALSIKVNACGDGLAGPVDKSEGLESRAGQASR